MMTCAALMVALVVGALSDNGPCSTIESSECHDLEPIETLACIFEYSSQSTLCSEYVHRNSQSFACAKDAAKLCPETARACLDSDFCGITPCLADNYDTLSSPCRQALSTIPAFNCRFDIHQLCSDVSNPTYECIRSNLDEVSGRCRASVATGTEFYGSLLLLDIPEREHGSIFSPLLIVAFLTLICLGLVRACRRRSRKRMLRSVTETLMGSYDRAEENADTYMEWYDNFDTHKSEATLSPSPIRTVC